jgi:hypothetical protein
MCQRAEAGEVIPEEVIKQYWASRAQLQDISMLLLEDPVVYQGRKKFGLAGELFGRAIGFLRKKKAEPGQSATLAKSKRRGRLLEGLVEGQSIIGDMASVDAQLRGKDRV